MRPDPLRKSRVRVGITLQGTCVRSGTPEEKCRDRGWARIFRIALLQRNSGTRWRRTLVNAEPAPTLMSKPRRTRLRPYPTVLSIPQDDARASCASDQPRATEPRRDRRPAPAVRGAVLDLRRRPGAARQGR